jgi:hypothetical protein
MGLLGKLLSRRGASPETIARVIGRASEDSREPQGAYKMAVLGAETRGRLGELIGEVEAEIGQRAIVFDLDEGTMLACRELNDRLQQDPYRDLLEPALDMTFPTPEYMRRFNEEWPSAVEKYHGCKNTPDLLDEKAALLACYILTNLVAWRVYALMYKDESELSRREVSSIKLEEVACWYRIFDELAQRSLGPGSQSKLLAAYLQDHLAYLLALQAVGSPDTICHTMAVRIDEYGRYKKWLPEGAEPPFAGTLLWEAAKHIGCPLGRDRDLFFITFFMKVFMDRVVQDSIFELLRGKTRPH